MVIFIILFFSPCFQPDGKSAVKLGPVAWSGAGVRWHLGAAWLSSERLCCVWGKNPFLEPPRSSPRAPVAFLGIPGLKPGSTAQGWRHSPGAEHRSSLLTCAFIFNPLGQQGPSQGFFFFPVLIAVAGFCVRGKDGALLVWKHVDAGGVKEQNSGFYSARSR